MEAIRASSLAETRTVRSTEVLHKTRSKPTNAWSTAIAALCQNSAMFSRGRIKQDASDSIWFVWV